MVGTMANLIVCPGGMDSSIYAWVPSPGIEDHNNIASRMVLEYSCST